MPSPELDPQPIPQLEPTIGCRAIMFIHELRSDVNNPALYKDLIAKQWEHMPDSTRAELRQSIPPGASSKEVGVYWSRLLLERMFTFADDVDRELSALMPSPELGDL